MILVENMAQCPDTDPTYRKTAKQNHFSESFPHSVLIGLTVLQNSEYFKYTTF
ncbi:hypothetical protein [Leptospira meyeri]|uniref:hypothetical protein n=1 Tax=Leptospira meyeri TaxID=29508 RepID=UPI00223D2524|nr:hypothetical protein [Leptospira meyeri]MCW7487466.1 hypothetical protein [Leptospira meyeri]